MRLKLKGVIIFLLLFIVTACEEKAKPIIIKKQSIQTPISCLKIDTINKGNEFKSYLKKLYNFQDNCRYTLDVKFKKDIVCNSSYNVGMKSMGKFPKSFIQLEVRDGLTPIYSYYIDLYHNANIDDIKEGFDRLKKDIL